ncbi:MAG: hypothetical protein ABI690_34430 [Chloroflexota bacterium]
MAEIPDGDLPVDDTWVTVTEAAEKSGYNRSYMQKLAHKNWKLPEDQRTIRVRKPIYGYLLWMPDLIRYIDEFGRGPHLKKTD